MKIRPTTKLAVLEWLLVMPATLTICAASNNFPFPRVLAPALYGIGTWFVSSTLGLTVSYLVLPATAVLLGIVALWGSWHEDWLVRGAGPKFAILGAMFVAGFLLLIASVPFFMPARD